MAKYTVTYKCEHYGEVQIVGPEKERGRKIEWLETQICPDCKREQARLGVDAWTQARGLVILQGTEKQIAWANKIRKEIAEEQEKIVADDEATDDELLSYIIRAHKWALKQSKAAWWIDRRDNSGRSLMMSMIDELKAKDAKEGK